MRVNSVALDGDQAGGGGTFNIRQGRIDNLPVLGHIVTSLFIMEFAPGGTNFPHHRDGVLKLKIFREVPLSQAAEAHRMLEARQTAGKVLLIP